MVRKITRLVGVCSPLAIGAFAGVCLALSGGSAHAQSGGGCVECIDFVDNCDNVCGNCGPNETCGCNTRGVCKVFLD